MFKCFKALKNNKGEAMLISIVFILVFAVLGAVLTASAAALLVSAKGEFAREQAKIYGVSLSDSIENELLSVENIKAEDSASELSNFLYKNMNVFYDKDNNSNADWENGAENVKVFGTEGDESKNLPKTEISVFWDYDGREDFSHTILNVGVKCFFGEKEYEEQREYFLTENGESWYCVREPLFLNIEEGKQ